MIRRLPVMQAYSAKRIRGTVSCDPGGWNAVRLGVALMRIVRIR
jgi:hypothetical protein